jgi:REP element-mobilizing transposase RayT
MLLEPYEAQQLSLAFCYRVYFRWRTHRRQARPELTALNADVLNELLGPYQIHVLEAETSSIDSLVLASLRPEASVAATASIMKGRVSKWLREQLGLDQPTNLLGTGYFASTCGKSTSQTIEQYLETQAEHHGYLHHALPPVFVREFALGSDVEDRLKAKHSATILQYHVVLSTWNRQGVFSEHAAECVAESWRALERELRFAIRKVSFVPDHVHLAVKAHPALSPETLIVRLMNSGQELMWDRFQENVIRAGVERLWLPSGYIGSYGELASPQVSQYLRNWSAAP